MNPYNK